MLVEVKTNSNLSYVLFYRDGFEASLEVERGEGLTPAQLLKVINEITGCSYKRCSPFRFYTERYDETEHIYIEYIKEIRNKYYVFTKHVVSIHDGLIYQWSGFLPDLIDCLGSFYEEAYENIYIEIIPEITRDEIEKHFFVPPEFFKKVNIVTPTENEH